jgi:hypothetical protein
VSYDIDLFVFLLKVIIFFYAARLIISDPVEFHDRTFMTHLHQLPWEDQSFAQQFENVMMTGR